jgi:DNA-binding NarL/FixJ family response regulator
LFKLLVIEDHALVREGLLQTLRGLVRGAHSLGARDSESAIAQLEANPDIELILLDLMLPGLNGMSLLGVLRKRYPLIPVVVISALEDQDTMRKALGHGASGFVGKSSSSETLIYGLRKVLEGEVYVPEKYARLEEGSVRESKVYLTPTQTRVLDLLTEGYSNREIAELLGVTVGTVKMHLFNIYKLLNVSSRAQALIAVKKLKIRL